MTDPQSLGMSFLGKRKVMNDKETRLKDLNREIRECQRCKLYETRRNALCGEGNLDARLMMVAQAPGENEDREGRMFIGPSGKKLDELFQEAGLRRDEIYMTNLIKCMLPKCRKPKEDEIRNCSQYLDEEIEIINPKVIAPLGYYSTRYTFEKYEIPVPNPKLNFSEAYGKIVLSGPTKIFPLQHPAALIFGSELKEEMIKNYKKAKTLMVDCKWFPVCPIKFFYEEGKVDRKWIELYCRGDWESCVRYWKEERGESQSDNMLPDGKIDKNLR